MMLDAVHLAIVYEYGFWNKTSAGSKQLRRILCKYNRTDASLPSNQYGAWNDGSISTPLNSVELDKK